eukprot:221236-Pelagomonas_calceolata.AAC.3
MSSLLMQRSGLPVRQVGVLTPAPSGMCPTLPALHWPCALESMLCRVQVLALRRRFFGLRTPPRLRATSEFLPTSDAAAGLIPRSKGWHREGRVHRECPWGNFQADLFSQAFRLHELSVRILWEDNALTRLSWAPGRKGRVIKDDGGLASIANRTDKEDVGGLKGAVGGWPGGEAGLKKFLEVRACVVRLCTGLLPACSKIASIIAGVSVGENLEEMIWFAGHTHTRSPTTKPFPLALHLLPFFPLLCLIFMNLALLACAGVPTGAGSEWQGGQQGREQLVPQVPTTPTPQEHGTTEQGPIWRGPYLCGIWQGVSVMTFMWDMARSECNSTYERYEKDTAESDCGAGSCTLREW